MSSITIEELKKLPAESYQIIDVRDEIEISHGAVKGALACKPEEIMENPEVDKTRKLVICCSRGINSKEIAKKLEEEGLDAVSLEKGYIAWLMDAMKSSQDEDFVKNVEISLRKKFKKKIWSRFTKAINTYELVKPGDRIAVCISGGKDSMLMAKCFQELKLHNKFDFEVKFLVMDPGYSPANRQVIEENARRLNIPIRIFESDIFESVFNVEKSPCYLCARMRRGHLYAFAKEMGCNKIALGHHYDDVIETAVGNPRQVIIVICLTVMNGSEMMVRILLTDNAGISFPIRKSLLMHQIILISQGPPYISVCGKTCQHILPVTVIILCFHHGESPSVVWMHNNQISLNSQIHKCLNTLFNMLEMGWIESGKVPVIARSTAIIFREIILI